MFLMFCESLLFSPMLHLIDEKYCKDDDTFLKIISIKNCIDNKNNCLD